MDIDAKKRVTDAALAAGFSFARVGPVSPWPTGEHFAPWLEGGYHGDMAYLARAPEIRIDPLQRFPWARSALMVALCYRREDACSPAEQRAISCYAWGDDYHLLMTKRLKTLAATLTATFPGLQSYYFNDTSPVLERAAAAAAGLGWLGRNTMLINQQHGSYFFLGGMLLSLELAEDPPTPDRCGSCNRCLPACPTNAFVAPYILDARRCISYLTIEYRGVIPHALRPAMGTLVFGCDICQDVCPWNGRATLKEQPSSETAFAPRAGLAVTSRALLEELLLQDEATFRSRFSRSPIKRAKRHGLARNAAIALGNLGDTQAIVALCHAVANDPHPLVRAHAAWALGVLHTSACSRLQDLANAALLAATRDTDDEVVEEGDLARADTA